MIDLYQYGVLLALACMLVIVLGNVVTFPSLRKGPASPWHPRVSVLIPARNEEQHIGAALTSLRDQDYPLLEILVLDDGSTDATARIVREHADLDPRVRLLQGEPLPEGWTGKAYACHQLVQHATGEVLLFVDADTDHGPSSVGAGLSVLARTGAGLVTAIPHQRMAGFWEKVLLPLLAFNTFCYLPMALVPRTRDPRLAMANGQYMMFMRNVYRAVGGHRAVRTALVEDVWLSRLVKEHGYRLEVLDGDEQVQCRMYSSFRGIWEGFSKNLFAGFRYSLPVIGAVMVFNLATSVAPPLMAIMVPALADGTIPWYPAVLAQVCLLAAIRLLLAIRFRMDFWPIILHPLATVVFVGIALNSVVWVRRKGGARWKGRKYNFSEGTAAGASGV